MESKLPAIYQKRDNKFYFTYKGKQYYAGSTREAANQRLHDVVGSGNSDGPHSIKDAVKEYLDSIEGVRQSPDSVVTKRRTYNRVFADLPEVKSLFDLNSQVLESYRSKLLKSLKRPTINATFHQLSAFLEHFVERGVLAQNPVKRLGKLKEFPDPVPDYLNEDERRQLIEFCERGRTPYVRQRDRLLFTLILNTGLRRIEVAHLKWSDIDLVKRVLVVRDGKGGKHRVIAINDTLFEMLRDFPRRSDHVITTFDGKPITRRGLSDIAEKYVDRLNHHYLWAGSRGSPVACRKSLRENVLEKVPFQISDFLTFGGTFRSVDG